MDYNLKQKAERLVRDTERLALFIVMEDQLGEKKTKHTIEESRSIIDRIARTLPDAYAPALLHLLVPQLVDQPLSLPTTKGLVRLLSEWQDVGTSNHQASEDAKRALRKLMWESIKEDWNRRRDELLAEAASKRLAVVERIASDRAEIEELRSQHPDLAPQLLALLQQIPDAIDREPDAPLLGPTGLEVALLWKQAEADLIAAADRIRNANSEVVTKSWTLVRDAEALVKSRAAPNQ